MGVEAERNMSGTVREAEDGRAACWLADDGMTLVVKRRTSAGTLTATYDRTHDAGPFTDADVDYVLSEQRATQTMQPGQRNKTRRFVTRFGTLWLHVMTGPPTWRLPRIKREKDGTLMAGWLRLAAGVKFTTREPLTPARSPSRPPSSPPLPGSTGTTGR